jgi:ankyrin repeat protein
MAGAENETLDRLIMYFFLRANIAYANWIRMFDMETGRPFESVLGASRAPILSPLCYAARFGSSKVVNMLLQSDMDVNACGGLYGNALAAASSGGHEQIVKHLLKTRADVNALGGQHGSALHVASENGH